MFYLKEYDINGRTKKYNESVSCTRIRRLPVWRSTNAKGNKGEIVIRVEACGICAGDVKTYQADHVEWMGQNADNPGAMNFGNIVEIGPETKGNYKIGDRVTSEQMYMLGMQNCMEGMYWQVRGTIFMV